MSETRGYYVEHKAMFRRLRKINNNLNTRIPYAPVSKFCLRKIVETCAPGILSKMSDKLREPPYRGSRLNSENYKRRIGNAGRNSN